MKFPFHRTVASELTLWLSVITTIIILSIGVGYYFYAANSVTRELTAEAERTADEFSKLLVLPLFNLDHLSAQRTANIYLHSERISAIRIDVEGVGEIFNTLSSVSSSLPQLTRSISRDDLYLGSLELLFSDASIVEVKRQAIWATVFAVILVTLIYLIVLRLTFKRILVHPLARLNARLQEISEGNYEGRMSPVDQEDLNNIVNAANRMSAEIVDRTRSLAESERNYREIYNATSDAIIIHDAEDGSIVDVNLAMLDMYGYTREEALALEIADLSQAEVRERMQQALEDGPQVFNWQARRKDGSLFWVEVSLKKTLLGKQEVVLALVRDISKRLHLEERLRQSQKMEAIGTLAGGIAHDFNNILAAILGYAELALLRSDKETKIFGYLTQIEQASLRARDLIKQILTFSRKQQTEKMVLQLAPVIHEAVTLLRSSIPASVEIREDLASQAKVDIDPGQMHQVVMNLCTNGYQAMVNESGVLTVFLKDVHVGEGDNLENVDLEPGEYVAIEICDNGQGMTEEMKNKIFEPYYTTKGVEKGTGLGLAVVHGIVTSHQGVISVTSEPGQGTCFGVYLPITDNRMNLSSPSLGDEITDVEAGRKVMVVDDEEVVRELMEQILVHGGYEVEIFDDGATAWEAFASAPETWDVVITDLTMPEMGGVELAEKIGGLRSDIPVILCTGYGEMISAGVGEKGAVISACLQKPVTMQELFRAMGHVLQDMEKGKDDSPKEDI
ncbi:MAG: PAS domain S-box protein [Thermodesulfobacteriota bacterium]